MAEVTPTLNEIVYSIIEIIRPKLMSGDAINKDLVKFLVKNTRAALIRQDLNKAHTIDRSLIQDLGCVEVEIVDSAECCDIESECSFIRTKKPIPSLVELHNKTLLTRVGPIDKMGKAYEVLEYERVPYEISSENPFTNKLLKAFMMNSKGYVYLLIPKNSKSKMMIEYINIQGVFEDPEQLREYASGCSGSACYSDDEPFPVKHWMINSIRDIVIQKYLGVQSQARIDTSNDNKVNPEQQA